MKSLLYLFLTISFIGYSQNKISTKPKANIDSSKFKVERLNDSTIVGYPPMEIVKILKKIQKTSHLSFSNSNTVNVNMSAKLTQFEIQKLNEFAAFNAGVKECTVIHIDGCQSCILRTTCRCCGLHCENQCGYEVWGNYVKTTCGMQCWQCALEYCY